MYQKIRLESKRNEVFRVYEEERTVIEKNFMTEQGRMKEEEMLRWLRAMGIKVPQVYFSSDKIMILEDLSYETLLDWYEQMEEENRSDYETIILQLLSWLKSFYYSTKEKFGGQIVLKDINFRNFLVKDQEVYGIDFELSDYGTIEEDMGRLAAFALTYAPEMTEWKQNFNECLMCMMADTFQVNRESIVVEREKALEEIRTRRSKRHSY